MKGHQGLKLNSKSTHLSEFLKNLNIVVQTTLETGKWLKQRIRLMAFSLFPIALVNVTKN